MAGLGANPRLDRLFAVPTPDTQIAQTGAVLSNAIQILMASPTGRRPRGNPPRGQRPGPARAAGSQPPGGPRDPGARDRRRQRRRDPLKKHRAVVGDDARVQWTDRARAIVLLVLWIIVLGLALAGFVGLMLFVGSLILEILAE